MPKCSLRVIYTFCLYESLLIYSSYRNQKTTKPLAYRHNFRTFFLIFFLPCFYCLVCTLATLFCLIIILYSSAKVCIVFIDTYWFSLQTTTMLYANIIELFLALVSWWLTLWLYMEQSMLLSPGQFSLIILWRKLY